MSPETLPEPACQLGYTTAQLDVILGGRRDEFNHFMGGQTTAICATTADPGACRGGHGLVVYACDVRHFLAGGEPLD